MVDREAQLNRYLLWGYRRVYGFRSERCFPLIRALNTIQYDCGINGPVGEIGVFYGQLFLLLTLLQREGETALADERYDLSRIRNSSTVPQR